MQGAVSHQVWRYGAKYAHASGHAVWQALTVDGAGQEHTLYGAVRDLQTSLAWCAKLFEEPVKDSTLSGKDE